MTRERSLPIPEQDGISDNPRSWSEAMRQWREEGPEAFDKMYVSEIPRCANCDSLNVVERENRDDAAGYHAIELYCLDCEGSAE